MAFIGMGVDFDGDGTNEGFIATQLGAREEVCGKTFAADARELFGSYLELPESPCVILRCGFCHEDSVAYSKCPWCGAQDTWRHDRNIKFNSGWLECCRCKKRLGDNPCPKCNKLNNILNFHLLKVWTEDEARNHAEIAKKAADDWANPKKGFFSRLVPSFPSFHRFIYVRTRHPHVVGPVSSAWLICRFNEDEANFSLEFSNSPDGPWDRAPNLVAAFDKLGKVKPLVDPPVVEKVEPLVDPPVVRAAAVEAGVSVQGIDAEEAPSQASSGGQAGLWLRVPSGKTHGPVTKQQVLNGMRNNKIPEGTTYSDSPNGPWKPLSIKKRS